MDFIVLAIFYIGACLCGALFSYYMGLSGIFVLWVYNIPVLGCILSIIGSFLGAACGSLPSAILDKFYVSRCDRIELMALKVALCATIGSLIGIVIYLVVDFVFFNNNLTSFYENKGWLREMAIFKFSAIGSILGILSYAVFHKRSIP